MNLRCLCSAALVGYLIVKTGVCPVHKNGDLDPNPPAGYEDVQHLPGPGTNVTSSTGGTLYQSGSPAVDPSLQHLVLSEVAGHR